MSRRGLRVAQPLHDSFPQTGIAAIRFSDMELKVRVHPRQELVGAHAKLGLAGFLTMDGLVSSLDKSVRVGSYNRPLSPPVAD